MDTVIAGGSERIAGAVHLRICSVPGASTSALDAAVVPLVGAGDDGARRDHRVVRSFEVKLMVGHIPQLFDRERCSYTRVRSGGSVNRLPGTDPAALGHATRGGAVHAYV